MEMTTRALWTLIHGMGFGGLFLLACSGGIVERWRRYAPHAAPVNSMDERFVRSYFVAMAALAWLAVLSVRALALLLASMVLMLPAVGDLL